MTDADTVTHDWLRLRDDEELRWQSRPRIFDAALSVSVGLLVLAGGIVGAILETVLFAGLCPVGALIAIWSVLSNRRTWYVITTRGLYARTGVLGRQVRSVEHHRVQNSQYRQSVTGTLFGHGSVEIDVAGGPDITFGGIYDPDEIQAAIREQTGRSSGGRSIPGTREAWLDVLEELRELRTTLESER
jgi:uncharacterized membrane protein YdbT with pleckstrin-like domain